MLETHIVMGLLIFLPHTSSHASHQFFHGPNHHSYDFGS
jgi:hypothetical protein